MADAADAGPALFHLNLSRGFRGGERQTALLIRELAATGTRQCLVARADSPLLGRLADVEQLALIGVSGRRSALRATAPAALIHAHETKAAQVARIRHALSATPYVITRRVDNVPRSDPFTRSMYRRAARVVALSAAISRALESYQPGIEVRRIPSSASNLEWNPAWRERYRRDNDGKFVVGTVGVLDDSHKGQMTLIRAASELATRCPAIRFVLVGSGHDELRMRDAASGLDNLSFAGWVDNVGDYLASFDLFAFPSLREGLGSILIDAMQFGLPIVASRTGGIPELVVDGENGLLVAPGDVQEMSGAILRLYSNPGLRNAMAAANRRRSEQYGAALMAERYRSLYEEILPRLAEGTETG